MIEVSNMITFEIIIWGLRAYIYVHELNLTTYYVTLFCKKKDLKYVAFTGERKKILEIPENCYKFFLIINDKFSKYMFFEI